MEACVTEIYSWMACNKLKLNRDKTEFSVIHPKHRPRPSISDVKIAGFSVASTDSARDVGAILNFNGVMNDDHRV